MSAFVSVVRRLQPGDFGRDLDEEDHRDDVGVTRWLLRGTQRELDWQLIDIELHTHFNEELSAMGAFLDVLELKAQAGGDLVLGGADLAATFMRLDLVDEYRLYVHPVVIGRGKPFFPASDKGISLQLAETRTFGSGVVLLRYPRREAEVSEIRDIEAL